MEITSNLKAHDHTSSPQNSPSTTSHNQPSLPITTRSDPNSPYPTTFVTADTSSFKQVVQMLTGSSDSNHSPRPQTQNQDTKLLSSSSITSPSTSGGASTITITSTTTPAPTTKGHIIPPIKTAPKKQGGFKLYERRNSIKHLISPLTSTVTNNNYNYYYSSSTQSSSSLHHQTTSFSPRYKQEILSPSLLDFPSLTLSPVTPLQVVDPFDNKSSSSPSCFGPVIGNGPEVGPESTSEEEKAIAEKGFFLHPSPVSTPRDSQPQLLPLFPLSSPRISQP